MFRMILDFFNPERRWLVRELRSLPWFTSENFAGATICELDQIVDEPFMTLAEVRQEIAPDELRRRRDARRTECRRVKVLIVAKRAAGTWMPKGGR